MSLKERSFQDLYDEYKEAMYNAMLAFSDVEQIDFKKRWSKTILDSKVDSLYQLMRVYKHKKKYYKEQYNSDNSEYNMKKYRSYVNNEQILADILSKINVHTETIRNVRTTAIRVLKSRHDDGISGVSVEEEKILENMQLSPSPPKAYSLKSLR